MKMNTEAKWIDARFGEHWVENALKEYSPTMIAEIARDNGREVIKLQEALKLILKKCPDNPNVPFSYDVIKIIKDTLK